MTINKMYPFQPTLMASLLNLDHIFIKSSVVKIVSMIMHCRSYTLIVIFL